MKTLLTSLCGLLLASCAAPSSSRSQASCAADLSLVHLHGKVTQMPANSKWPASIKVGTPFDYWAVIDNRVPNTSTTPHMSSYQQKAWPSRYDLKVGDFRFSSDRLTPPTFAVSIQDELTGNGDAYVIASAHHTPVPEAPELEGVSFKISLFPKDHSTITTDQLPLHAIKVSTLTGGFNPHFRGIASLKSDHSDQTFGGTVDTFEVFQAGAEAPLSAPVR